MEWSNQKILEFIEDYRAHPVLWCSKLRDYKVKKFRNAAMKVLSAKYECDERALKTKIKSLRSYFHKEHSKTLKRKDAATGENYVSSWFAYNAMMFITEIDPLSFEHDTDMYGKYESNLSEGLAKFQDDKDVEGSEEDASNEVPFEENPDAEEAEIKFSSSLADISKSPKRRINDHNHKSSEAQSSPKRAQSTTNSRDEFSIFGEHVACKLRKLNDGRLQSIAEQQINNILFNIEMANVYQPRNVPATNCLQSTIISQPANLNENT